MNKPVIKALGLLFTLGLCAATIAEFKPDSVVAYFLGFVALMGVFFSLC